MLSIQAYAVLLAVLVVEGGRVDEGATVMGEHMIIR
jgi:hypothetical protein